MTMTMAANDGRFWATNTQQTYDRLSGSGVPGRHRWIGRCKRCNKTHRLEGELVIAHAPGRHDFAVKDDLGMLWATATSGTSTVLVWVPCGEHHCLLRRVVEGTKRSKHECGARCTNATGPNCDCRCRGQNHGSNC